MPSGLPRGLKFVAMKPPSSSHRTEFSPIGSGATAQPIQVSVGVGVLVSTVKTSIDSRAPCVTVISV